MQAILLAAGFGTRLQPYTYLKPKPLFPVVNKPLLHILLDKLIGAGCISVVVNCHHLAEQVTGAVEGYNQVRIQYEPEILGTGGSLRRALNTCSQEPLLVMNGDIYHDIDLAAVHAHHQESGNGVTMVMHDCPRFNTVGVNGDRVETFKPGLAQKRLAFTGIHVVEPWVLEKIPEDIFYHIIDLYEQLAGEDQVGMLCVEGGQWHDIGTPADYLALHAEILGGANNAKRWHIANSADVAEDVILEDWGTIGEGAVIGSKVHLCRTVVWDKACIPSGARYCNAIVTGNEAYDSKHCDVVVMSNVSVKQ